MPPYEYAPIQSPFVGSIADTMQRPAQALAAAEIAKGNAWANAAQGAGQAVGGAIQQAIDPRRQLEQQQLSDVKRNSALAAAGQQFSRQADAIVAKLGQRQPDGSVAYDRTKLVDFFTQSGIPPEVQAEKFKTLDTIEQSIKQFHQNRINGLADLAHAALQDPDAQTPAGFMMLAGLAKANGMVTDEQTTPIGVKLAEGADPRTLLASVRSLSEKYKDAEKPISVPAGGSIYKDGLGIVATAAPEPGKGDYTVNGQRFHANGQPIGPAVPKQAEPPKPGTVEDWVDRSRRLAVQQNGGQPLTDEQTKRVDAKALGEFKENNADPVLRAQAIAQKNIAELLAKAQLDQMPTKEQAKSVADDLVNHRVSPSQLASLFSTRGKEGLAFKLAVTAEAKKQDPHFNFEEAESEYNLAKSTGFQNTVRYMDSVQESMPQLLKSATKLGNGNFRTWNDLSNAAANQFNSTDLKRFKTDALLVGDEVAKILSGGGSGSATSDAKLKQATDIISTGDSVPAIAAALGEIDTLIGFRRKAMTRGTYMEGSSAVKPAAETPKNPFRK